MRLRRAVPAVPALAVVLAASACGADDADDAAAATPSPAIPFTEADVVQDGDAYTISWAAEDAGDVTVYAGTDPTGVGRDREVGAGDGTGELHVAGLPAATRWYFELVPEEGEPLVVADRSLHLASAPNFRDIGGYRTEDGRWVRMGVLYRSDGLDDLSPEDTERLLDLGIHLVCDLRTDGERAAEPDPEMAGVANEQFDVGGDSGNLTQVITDAILSGDPAVQQQMLGGGRGEQIMLDGARSVVSDDSARAAYTAVFDRIAEPSSVPTVFHCTAGKDRTGWAAAALLSAVGVPRETVVEDYLRSNDELAEANAQMLQRVGGLIDPALLEPMLGVDRQYIEAAFDEVAEDFGDLDGYLRDGIGVDSRQREALEDLLLAG